MMWQPLESHPEPESPDGEPYWKSPASGYPGALAEKQPDPGSEPVPELPVEPDAVPNTPAPDSDERSN
ncbi:hypothetical protein ACFWU5_26300 [Nocardia sp. NPDC058640]|uniref:hypothetical protein n=1 Tax=Nocardia sp. NPDC058640 TaxID=3346571 RepID=UPI00364CF3C8